MSSTICPNCNEIIVDPDDPVKTVVIKRDKEPGNPRKDFDNLGTMVCFHKRYNLGDDPKDHGLRSDDFSGWGELEKHLWEELDAVVVLPLFLYDHSGITVSTSPFSCPWDSGQIGFMFITREMAIKEYSEDACAPEQLTKIEQYLRNEVRTYDDYLTNNCWGYEVYDEHGDCIDSCWGFLGGIEENGIKEHVQTYLDDGYALEESF